MRYKKSIMLAIILLTLSIMTNAQHKDSPQPINISDTLSYDQFQEIKQFILDKGQTRTYCNMYNNNPYYAFEGESEIIDLYLNPIVQILPETDLKTVDKYNVIVLKVQDVMNTYVNIYANSKTKEVYLTSYYDTEQSLKEKASKIAQYTECILTEIENDKKE